MKRKVKRNVTNMADANASISMLSFTSLALDPAEFKVYIDHDTE